MAFYGEHLTSALLMLFVRRKRVMWVSARRYPVRAGNAAQSGRYVLPVFAAAEGGGAQRGFEPVPGPWPRETLRLV